MYLPECVEIEYISFTPLRSGYLNSFGSFPQVSMSFILLAISSEEEEEDVEVELEDDEEEEEDDCLVSAMS
ncbi:MAG: hypothetical protein EZS28_012838 [Streblomastix strix]|uniref:Uncharacterized protein n=1 Tax=Streblomastix strix TaxID=222440 RepID=A0A5J4W9N5_9EUKA|nr:MAG: hypothetical protein EZS28_012838 [Streblomastix strix]